MTKIRFSGANNWHHAYLTELQGKIQEEERDCYETRSCLKSDSAGRNHVFGRTRRCGADDEKPFVRTNPESSVANAMLSTRLLREPYH
jgi:hypothetical protein